jgi:hypothetical protein
MTHEYITYVADRAASREVEALFDFYSLGRLIVANELTYDAARDQLVTAFAERDMQSSTARTYLSQGYSLAQLFDTFDEVEEFADDACNGSRSMKRVYDTVRAADKGDAKGEGEGEAPAKVATALVDVILANLAQLTDPAEIAKVRDAAIAKLVPVAVAA